MVYVLDIAGKPLMPMERHGKVRRLLRDGKAHVVKFMPFTIQLDYESKRFRQEVSLGVDAGSVHIGVSATTEKKELFAAEVVLRTDIVKKISKRRELRDNRRYRKTRYRAARFDNRRKKKGWLVPSIRNKVESHLKIIRMIHDILPVGKITIEVAQFDTQKIKNDKIQGVEYQHGEQLGFWNVREYILARDGYKCQHCKGKSGDKILNVHHLESRKTGGDAPNNLITLCKTCHKAYHRGEFCLTIKRGTSLRDAAIMSVMRWAMYEQVKKEFKNVHLTYGYFTKHMRIQNHLKKTHCIDAFCVSGNINAVFEKWYYYCVFVHRHYRSLHVVKPSRHNKRRIIVGNHWIGKYKLQKFDTVKYDNKICFIKGSTGGRFVLSNLQNTYYPPTRTVNGKCLKFLRRNKNILMQKYARS